MTNGGIAERSCDPNSLSQAGVKIFPNPRDGHSLSLSFDISADRKNHLEKTGYQRNFCPPRAGFRNSERKPMRLDM